MIAIPYPHTMTFMRRLPHVYLDFSMHHTRHLHDYEGVMTLNEN
jgi:hypothetical protein